MLSWPQFSRNSQNISINCCEKNIEVFRLSEKFKCFFFLFKNMAETNSLLLAYASEKIYLTSYLPCIIKLWGDMMNTLNYKIDKEVKLIRKLLNLFQEQFA